MKYNREFTLNLSDIDVIENCLSKELHVRSGKYQVSEQQEDTQEMNNTKQSISEITELLGKIHNQKIWYAGDPEESLVPKG